MARPHSTHKRSVASPRSVRKLRPRRPPAQHDPWRRGLHHAGGSLAATVQATVAIMQACLVRELAAAVSNSLR